jgi:hypothetical protein
VANNLTHQKGWIILDPGTSEIPISQIKSNGYPAHKTNPKIEIRQWGNVKFGDFIGERYT